MPGTWCDANTNAERRAKRKPRSTGGAGVADCYAVGERWYANPYANTSSNQYNDTNPIQFTGYNSTDPYTVDAKAK